MPKKSAFLLSGILAVASALPASAGSLGDPYYYRCSEKARPVVLDVIDQLNREAEKQGIDGGVGKLYVLGDAPMHVVDDGLEEQTKAQCPSCLTSNDLIFGLEIQDFVALESGKNYFAGPLFVIISCRKDKPSEVLDANGDGLINEKDAQVVADIPVVDPSVKDEK